jgi:hypothetical protein
MLKAKLDSLEGLDESLQSFYAEKDGVFQLQVDGLEDTGALKRAKDHEKAARQEAEAAAAQYQAQLTELNQKIEDSNKDKARKNGDVEALENSWKEKLNTRESELNSNIESLKGNLHELLVDNVAGKLAAELAVEGSSNLLVPHIQSRLSVEERNGKMVTVVKDKDGRPSAATIEELREEFKNNAAFAPVIVGSKASGGGAGANQNKGGGASNQIDFSKSSPKQIADYLKAKRGN